MLVDLEGEQGKDGGQRRKDDHRHHLLLRPNKTKQKIQQATQACMPIHPFNIQWLPLDLPTKFKMMWDRRKGTSKKT